MPDNDYDDEFFEEGPSKSEVKRQMTALQALGERLVGLSDKQLAAIEGLDESLLEAVQQTQLIKSNSARKRHLQYIGKLMRNLDPAPIERAFQEMDQRASARNDQFHELEALRDQLLSEGVNAIEGVLQRWPDADRQQLRQLVLQHQREMKKQKPPAASRKLFKYLRELQEASGGSD